MFVQYEMLTAQPSQSGIGDAATRFAEKVVEFQKLCRRMLAEAEREFGIDSPDWADVGTVQDWTDELHELHDRMFG